MLLNSNLASMNHIQKVPSPNKSLGRFLGFFVFYLLLGHSLQCCFTTGCGKMFLRESKHLRCPNCTGNALRTQRAQPSNVFRTHIWVWIHTKCMTQLGHRRRKHHPNILLTNTCFFPPIRSRGERIHTATMRKSSQHQALVKNLTNP